MASARHLLQQTSGRGTYLGDLSPHGPGPSSTNSPSPGTGGSAIMAPSEDPSPSAKLYNLTSHFPGWSVVHPPGPGQEGTGGDAGGLPYYPYDGNSGSGVDTAAVASSRDQLSPMTSTTSTLLASTADVLGNVSFSPFDFLCDDNDTFCEFNLTMGKDVDENEIAGYKYWTLLLAIFPVFTVFGNVLVVLSVVREKSLKTVTNYFICSLAVADIMVAVVVMPFAVYVEVRISCPPAPLFSLFLMFYFSLAGTDVRMSGSFECFTLHFSIFLC